MWCVSLYFIEWYQLYKSFGIGTLAEVRSYLFPSGSVFLLKVVVASCGTHLMVFSSGEVFRPTIIHLQIVEALESHA